LPARKRRALRDIVFVEGYGPTAWPARYSSHIVWRFAFEASR